MSSVYACGSKTREGGAAALAIEAVARAAVGAAAAAAVSPMTTVLRFTCVSCHRGSTDNSPASAPGWGADAFGPAAGTTIGIAHKIVSNFAYI
ncbi:hypothetical protein GCM10010431_61910 [Streptomyces kunmingensis]